jgi:hypothetical protein
MQLNTLAEFAPALAEVVTSADTRSNFSQQVRAATLLGTSATSKGSNSTYASRAYNFCIIPADKKMAIVYLKKIHLKLGRRGGQTEIVVIADFSCNLYE